MTIEFKEKEIREARRRVKKAAGPDRIPPEITNLLAKEKSKQLTEIFNSLLCKGKFPKEWKTGGRLVLIENPGKKPRMGGRHIGQYVG